MDFQKRMDECKERIDKVRDIITKRREEEENEQSETIATRRESVVQKFEESLNSRFITKVILEEDEYDDHVKDWLKGLSVEEGLSIDFGVGGKPRVVYAVSLK